MIPKKKKKAKPRKRVVRQRPNVLHYVSRATLRAGEGSITILVVAGNLKECHDYVEKYKVSRWVYVRSELLLRKYSALSRVVLYGSYRDRPDILSIMQAARKDGYIIDDFGLTVRKGNKSVAQGPAPEPYLTSKANKPDPKDKIKVSDYSDPGW